MGLEEVSPLNPDWQECPILKPAGQGGRERASQLIAFPQSDRLFPMRDRYRYSEVVKRRREYCKPRELRWSSELSEADSTDEAEHSDSEETSDSDSKSNSDSSSDSHSDSGSDSGSNPGSGLDFDSDSDSSDLSRDFPLSLGARNLITITTSGTFISPRPMTDQKMEPILQGTDDGEKLLLDAPGPRKSPEPSITDRASKSESSSRYSKSSKSGKSGKSGKPGQHKEKDKGDLLGLAALHLTIGSLESREKSLKKIKTEIKERQEERKKVKKQETCIGRTSKLGKLDKKIEKLKMEKEELETEIEKYIRFSRERKFMLVKKITRVVIESRGYTVSKPSYNIMNIPGPNREAKRRVLTGSLKTQDSSLQEVKEKADIAKVNGEIRKRDRRKAEAEERIQRLEKVIHEA
ncbi:uncharacterized protein B0J16DRAFT_404579 [Fusarium flagelliforme]|uniref:uncharacterized protein n=1 Tax=Fusarium flagelliforme TaxID=2675880 RepID=UPI001E8E31C2|nr:uncharacterized protein B0J16DRAFT_404579 [Fusarium flagelliforme]KAH7174803.1 hypothetical protein B0J16DRAFT_404579 [Fusarium flagelliforme]